MSFFDNIITGFDYWLKLRQREKSTTHPGTAIPEADLTSTEKKQIIRKLRVDHTGEVCAQGLYLGQALTAKDKNLKQHLLHAAQEEQQHLRWCQLRLNELGGNPSILNPLFSLGSLVIGAFASICGNAASLGFLAETERQVDAHLTKQLQQMPLADQKTRAILEQMRADEAAHSLAAVELGGKELPTFICNLMHCSAKVMTTTTEYI